MPKTKRKLTTDAVAIIHRRYYEGKPDRLAALEQARANDDVARKIAALRAEAGLSQRHIKDERRGSVRVRRGERLRQVDQTAGERNADGQCHGEIPGAFPGDASADRGCHGPPSGDPLRSGRKAFAVRITSSHLLLPHAQRAG